MRCNGLQLSMTILLAPALAACTHSVVRVNTSNSTVSSVPAGTSVSAAGIQASSDTRLGAAIIIAVMVADGLRYYRVEPDGTRIPVDAGSAQSVGVAPRVSVQDCSRPVDLSAGNLLCR